MAEAINAGREFDAIDLHYVIGAPLVATVKAQAAAAEATRRFIESTFDPKTRQPLMVNFSVNEKTAQGTTGVSVDAPLLSIVPVPHLRIDSLDIDFKYSISQTTTNTHSSEWGVDGEVKANAGWGWGGASITIKGHAASKSAEESTVNRSGMLNVRVHASEAPMPEGLARMLTILANALQSGKGEQADGGKK